MILEPYLVLLDPFFVDLEVGASVKLPGTTEIAKSGPTSLVLAIATQMDWTLLPSSRVPQKSNEAMTSIDTVWYLWHLNTST